MPGPFYISEDGKTVLTYELATADKILLSDGRTIVPEDRRLFAVAPSANPRMRQDEYGYWWFQPSSGQHRHFVQNPRGVAVQPVLVLGNPDVQ